MENLQDKAVDIRGKKYVLVSDRILYFNEKYPEGSILTELVSSENDTFIMKATIKPDKSADRIFTGYSQAVKGQGMVNKTAALENAETSAVGRALAMMGIGVIESIASADEMRKSINFEPKQSDISEEELNNLFGPIETTNEIPFESKKPNSSLIPKSNSDICKDCG